MTPESVTNAPAHLPFDELVKGLELLTPPQDSGRVALVVVRSSEGARETPAVVTVTPECGVPGDRWSRSATPRPDAQITVMRADFARLIGNGQPLTVPGDNLLVDFDLSQENVPAGTRLRAGTALLVVTPLPHTGCAKFAARFGQDALRLTADRRYRHLRLRGIHVRVLEAGEIAPGDGIEILERAPVTHLP